LNRSPLVWQKMLHQYAKDTYQQSSGLASDTG
jgi:hypothetical protein